MTHKNRTNSNNINKPSKTSRKGVITRTKKNHTGNCTSSAVRPWKDSVIERLSTKRELLRLKQKLNGGSNYYI